MSDRKEVEPAAKVLAARLKDTREYLGLSQQFVSDQTRIPPVSASPARQSVTDASQ